MANVACMIEPEDSVVRLSLVGTVYLLSWLVLQYRI